VPLSPSATDELRVYLRARHTIDPHPAPTSLLLCSCIHRPYSPEGLSNAIKNAMTKSGVWAGATRMARVHDFRHGFAVAALRRWYEADADVQANLPKLALYMGHVSIASTAYYLRFMPAVVTLASQRFNRACGDIVDGGAP
jgi:integrase